MPTRDSVLAMLCSSAQASIPVWNSRSRALAVTEVGGERPGHRSGDRNQARVAERIGERRDLRVEGLGFLDAAEAAESACRRRDRLHLSPLVTDLLEESARFLRPFDGHGRAAGPHRDVGEEDPHHAVRPAVR